MKITTIEQYIRHTDKLYTDILAKAIKGGLQVKQLENGNTMISDSLNRTIELQGNDKENINDGAFYVMYNYSK